MALILPLRTSVARQTSSEMSQTQYCKPNDSADRLPLPHSRRCRLPKREFRRLIQNLIGRTSLGTRRPQGWLAVCSSGWVGRQHWINLLVESALQMALGGSPPSVGEWLQQSPIDLVVVVREAD